MNRETATRRKRLLIKAHQQKINKSKEYNITKRSGLDQNE